MSQVEEIVALVIKHQPMTGPELDKVRPKGWKFSGSIKLSDIWRTKRLSRVPRDEPGTGPKFAYAAPDYPGGMMFGGKQLPAVVPKVKKSKIPDTVQPYPGSDKKIVVEIGGKRLTIEDI